MQARPDRSAFIILPSIALRPDAHPLNPEVSYDFLKQEISYRRSIIHVFSNVFHSWVFYWNICFLRLKSLSFQGGTTFYRPVYWLFPDHFQRWLAVCISWMTFWVVMYGVQSFNLYIWSFCFTRVWDFGVLNYPTLFSLSDYRGHPSQGCAFKNTHHRVWTKVDDHGRGGIGGSAIDRTSRTNAKNCWLSQSVSVSNTPPPQHCRPKRRCWTSRRGGPKSHFLLGRLWWMSPNNTRMHR